MIYIIDNDFPKKMKRCRADQGLSQERAAELLGISRQALSSIENGKSMPSQSTFKKIIELYRDLGGNAQEEL